MRNDTDDSDPVKITSQYRMYQETSSRWIDLLFVVTSSQQREMISLQQTQTHQCLLRLLLVAAFHAGEARSESFELKY
jgi:hypothetical protein